MTTITYTRSDGQRCQVTAATHPDGTRLVPQLVDLAPGLVTIRTVLDDGTVVTSHQRYEHDPITHVRRITR